MGIDIEVMTIADYDEVIELWRGTEGIGLHEFEDSREGIAMYLDRNPGMSFVARSEGKLVGAVLCGHDGRRGFINHLVVNPEFRKQGIGKEMVDRCLGELGERGIRKCNIVVFRENSIGRGFWLQLGWNERPELVNLQYSTIWEAGDED